MSRLRHLPLVAAAVPPALLVVMVARHVCNVPYKDQWGHIPFIVDAARGVFTPAALWHQENEHRIPVARVVQGLLAWWTRWDVRYEAWADVGIALLSFAALVAVVWRTVRPHVPAAAPWVVLIVSVLHFSLAQGYVWIWGAMMPTYLATLAAACAAWVLVRFDGWRRTVGLLGCGVFGALSFGTGLVLLGLVPLAVVVSTARASHRATAAVVAGAVTAVYLVGWHARADPPPPVPHGGGLADYARYLCAYLGSTAAGRDLDAAVRWGAGEMVALAVASAWCVRRGWPWRATLAPWWLLAAYALGAGALTAYGRVQYGLDTALLPRYLATGELFTMSVVVIGTLAVSDVFQAARGAGLALVAAAAPLLWISARTQYELATTGVTAMALVQRQLDEGARCLTDCRSTTDACLLRMCWSASVARAMCPALEEARLGPFAR